MGQLQSIGLITKEHHLLHLGNSSKDYYAGCFKNENVPDVMCLVFSFGGQKLWRSNKEFVLVVDMGVHWTTEEGCEECCHAI